MTKRAEKRKPRQEQPDPMLLEFVRALARDLAESHIRDSRRKAGEPSEDQAGVTQ
jgi:hypothetical protein